MASQVRDWSLFKGRERRSSGVARARRGRSRRLGIEGLEPRALLTTLLALTNDDHLLQIDSSAPGTIQKTITITGVPTGEKIVSVALRIANGDLIGFGSDNKLYDVNPSTGVASAISTTAVPGLVGQPAISVDPVSDVIRLVNDSGQNFRLDPTDGHIVATDTLLTYAATDTNMSQSPNVTAIANTGMFTGATNTTVYGIDSGTNTFVKLGDVNGNPTSPNSGILQTVGLLGVTVKEMMGLDIPGTINTAYAAMTETSGSTPALYSINTTTGAATKIGTIGNGTVTILGLTNPKLGATPSAPNLAASSDSGVSNSDHITNIKTPVITGTADPNATIIAEDPNSHTQYGTGKADGNGNYSFALDPLVDGTYTVSVRQTNGAGLNSADSAPLSPVLVIKTSAPAPGVPQLISSTDTGLSNTDHYTRNNTPAVSGSGEIVGTTGDIVSIYANGVLVGQGAVQAGNVYFIQLGQFTDGTYQVTAQQTDVAGNVSPLSGPMTPPLIIDTSSRPTPAEAFINQAYLDLLGRPADQAAFATYTPLVTGPAGRTAVIRGILATQEYRQHVVITDYQTLLHRAPEASAITIGANYLLTHTDEQLKAVLVGSGEYYQLHGNTNASFLAAMYQDLLGRPIDPTAQARYLNALAGGALPMNLALIVLTSQEGFTVTSTNLFQSLLHRTPDAASVTNMVSLLTKGGKDEDLITILAGSQEYYQNSRGSDTVINQWITQAYRDLLGRVPTDAELASAKAQLNTGATPASVIAGLQATPEYLTILINQAYGSILGRAPEASAITGGIAYLSGGGTVQGLEALLYGSDEYFVSTGGNTNAAFLASLYQNILGRAIDSGAAAAGLAYLNGGGSRVALSQGLLESLESSQRIVQSIYVAYLRRNATFAETTAAGSALNRKALTYQQVIGIVVGSPEYFSDL